VDGVIKLLNGLKNGKSPLPDEIGKEDLVFDPITSIECLSISSKHHSKTPKFRLNGKWLMFPLYINVVPLSNQTTMN